MGCFPPNLSLQVDSLNSGKHTNDWCCHGGIGPPSTARRRMVAPGDSPVGPIGPPEIYQRLGPERTARGDFSSIGPVSREGKRGRETGRGASPPWPSLAGEARGEQVGDAVGPADGLGGHPGVGPLHEGVPVGAAEKLAEAAVGYRGAESHVAPPEPPCGLPKMARRLAPAAPPRGQGGP